MVDSLLRQLQQTIPSGEQFYRSLRPALPKYLTEDVEALIAGRGLPEHEARAPDSLLGLLTGREDTDRYQGTALGVGDTLMNAADTLYNRVSLPLVGRGLAGARRLDEMRGLQPVAGALPVPTGDTPEEWAKFAYDEAGAEAGLPGQMLLSAFDPNMYMPVGRVAKLAREAGPVLKAAGGQRAVVGSLLEKAGEAGMAFQKHGDEYVPALIGQLAGGAGNVARHVPGGKQLMEAGDWLMGPSGRSRFNKVKGEAESYLSSVVQGLPKGVSEAGEPIAQTFKDWIQGIGSARPKGRKQWGHLQEGWTALEDTANALEGPHRKLGAAQLIAKYSDDKNMIDAAAAREIAEARRATLLPKDSPDYLSPDEFNDFKNARYQRQGDEQESLQMGAQTALEQLRDADFAKPKVRFTAGGELVPDPADQASREAADALFDTAIGKYRTEVFGKRDMVKTSEGFFNPADEAEMEAFEGAADSFYRAGRAAAASTATRLSEDILHVLPGGLDDASAKMIDGSMEAYLKTSEEMLRLSAPIEERLGPVSEQAGAFIGDQARQLKAAGRKVEGLYNRVSRSATSILREAYDPNGKILPTTVGTVNERVAAAMENSRTLATALKDAQKKWEELGLPGRRADIKTTIDTLAQNIPHGDVLQPGDWLQLTVNRWGDTVGPSYGVTKPGPALSAFNGVMNLWRGSALLSPRFQIANLAFGLFANDRAGVNAVETAKNLGRNFSNVHQQVMTQYRDAHPDFDPSKPFVSFDGMKPRFDLPGMKGRYDAWVGALAEQQDYVPGVVGGGADLMTRLGRVNQDGAATYAGTGAAAAGAQQFAAPFGRGAGASARNAAIWGGAGLVGGAAKPAEDDEARTENMVRGMLGGAAFGSVTPQLGWAAKLMFSAIEEALRKTAVHTAMQPAMVNAHEGVIARMRGRPAPEVETISRPVTRGGRPVETAEQLTGLPVAVVAPPGATRPGPVRGALGGSRAGMLAGPLSDDAQFALIRLRSLRKSVEAAEASGDPAAAMLRDQYGRLVAGSDPLVRAMHTGAPAPGPVAPDPMAPDPWYEPIKGQRPTDPEALRAQRRADIEQMDRRHVSYQQAEDAVAEAEAYLAERHTFIQSGPGGDAGHREEYNYAQFHRLPPEDQQLLDDAYKRREDVALGREAPEGIAPEEMDLRADMPDLSLTPLQVAGAGVPSPILTATHPAGALDELERFMRARVADEGPNAGIMLMSPGEIAQEAIRLGIAPQWAHAVGGEWDHAIRQAERAGHNLANTIHGDYGDVSRLTEFLRSTGIFPFLTWSVKMAPNAATWLIQDPRLIIAIDRMNNLTEAELDEAGLPARFDRLGRTGQLGDAIAEHILGRPDATMMANPSQMFNPYAEFGKLTDTAETQAPGYERPPLARSLDVLGAVGLSPGPIPSLLGRATGLTEDYGSPIFRTSAYVEALSGVGGGSQVDPEQLSSNIIRSFREQLTGKRQPTLTGNPTVDYAVRQRIAETAYEKTGKAATGAYKQAMDDPKSAIWKQALREVNRQRAGQLAVGSTLPFRTKLLTETTEEVAAAKKRAGTRSEDLAGLPQEQVDRLLARGRTTEPLSTVLSGLGGTEEQTMKRMVSAYFDENTRVWKKMTPERRYAAQIAYLRDKPLLQRALGERGYLPHNPKD